jgi:hypothetical protein
MPAFIPATLLLLFTRRDGLRTVPGSSCLKTSGIDRSGIDTQRPAFDKIECGSLGVQWNMKVLAK